jgi:D-alanyl-D-alanine carboxypeptidase
MQVGLITVDGRPIGNITWSTDEPDLTTPALDGGEDNLSGRAGGTDTGKSFHHHGIGHSRPSHGHSSGHRHGPGHYARGEAREKAHEDKGHDYGHRHGPGHFARGEERQKEQTKEHGANSKGNPFDRERFRKELDDPAVRERAKNIMTGENLNEEANLGVIESAMNRANVRGTSLEKQLQRHKSSGKDERGYYAGWNPNRSAEQDAMEERNIEKALGGSNITNYATDNSSGDLARREKESGAFKHHRTIAGESFFSPGSAEPRDRDHYQAMRKQAGGNAGTSASSPSAGSGSANYMHGQHGAPGENLTTIKTLSGKPFTVHQDAARSFKGLVDELEAGGYKIHDIGGHNHRTIRGSNRLSQHAYGNAIDINPDSNPQHGGTNLPPNISEMAARHGLSWGGDWSERYRDPMHFEWTGGKPSSKTAEE